MGSAAHRNAVDSRSVQRLTSTDALGNLLSGDFRTNTYTQPTVASATPTAWTTGNSPVTLFTVTGAIMCRVFGVTGATALTSTGGTGTLAVGIPTSAGLFLATTTVNGTTNFVISSVWLDTTPTVLGEVLAGNALTWTLVNNSIISLVIATNSMTAGAMSVYCQWVPVSAGATVV